MKKAATPILVAFVVAILAGYVTAYFLRGELTQSRAGFGRGMSGRVPPPSPDFYRWYPTELEFMLFRPAASMESLLTRKWVQPAIQTELLGED